MAFDIAGARRAGYSDDEIADYLGSKARFDVTGAREAGYSTSEIMAHLSGAWARQDLPEGVEPSTAGAGRGRMVPEVQPPDVPSPADAAVPQPQPREAAPGRGVARRGGTRAEARPFVASSDDLVTPSALDQPAPGTVPSPAGLSEQEMAEGSIAPWRLEQMRTQAGYGDTSRSPVLKPFTTEQNIAQDVREATRNPVARGAVAGFSQLGKVGTGGLRLAADLLGADAVSEFAGGASKAASTVGDGATRDLQGNDKLIANVTSSIANTVPAVAMGMFGGPAMTTLFAQSALAEYNEGRDAGFDVGSSLSRAGIMAVAEVAGERFGFPEQIKLLKGVARGMPQGELAKTVANMLMKEVPGEQLTTIVQFMADKIGPAALRPNATLADYLEAAGETLKVTIGQTAVMGGGPAAIVAARNEYRAADQAIGRSTQSMAERAAADAGFRPADRIKAIDQRLDDFAATHGVAPKAVQAAKAEAAKRPIEERVPYLKRALAAFRKNGLVGRQFDDAALAGLDEPPAPSAQPAAIDTLDAGAIKGELGIGADYTGLDTQGAPDERVPVAAGPGSAGSVDAGPADAGRGGAPDGRPTAQPMPAVPEGVAAGAAAAGDAGLAGGADDAAVTPLAGEKIDDEWTAFAPESGTKAVPRADMPQIKAEHRGAMTQFLKGRGIEHEQETDVDPATLKPTQAEFSPAKVQKAREFSEGDRAILVSNDGHILDGHHQWAAALADGKPIRVIRLDAPIEQLLPVVREFPSAAAADGATAAAAPAGVGTTHPAAVEGAQASVAAAPEPAAAPSAPTAQPAQPAPTLDSGSVGQASQRRRGKLIETWTGTQKKGMLIHAAQSQMRDQQKRRPDLQWSIVPAPEFAEDRFKLEGRAPVAEFAAGDRIAIDGQPATISKVAKAHITAEVEGGGKRVVAFDSPTMERIRAARDAAPAAATQEGAAVQPTGAASHASSAPARKVYRTRAAAAKEAKALGNTHKLQKEEAGYFGLTPDEQARVDAMFEADMDAESNREYDPIAELERQAAEIEAEEERDAITQADAQDAQRAGGPENAAAREPQEGARGGEEAQGAARGRPGGEEGGQEGLTLTAQTEPDLRAKAEREAAAERAEAAEQRRLSDKERADAEAGEFTLTGSDRPADVAAAGGQQDLLERAPLPASGAVGNFGQALPPSRRQRRSMLDEALSADDIRTKPLSEIWPAAENEAIDDKFAAAVAHAAREEIPAKPRKGYKLDRWIDKVQTLRDMAQRIVSGEVSRERFMDKSRDYKLGGFISKVALLEAIDRSQWKRIGQVQEHPHAYTYVEGKQTPAPQVLVEIDDRARRFEGSGSLADHLEAINELLGTPMADKRMQFEIRTDRKGAYFINKKGDSEYRVLMTFTSAENARKAMRERYDALVAAWEAVKERDNVTERDLRSAENRDRTGEDWRKGRDITADEFEDRFGFKGGEWGKWVEQGKGTKERQWMLNRAYDALMDLAQIVGVPPRALSLNGTLGIAFGARGSGWASAHFEPDTLVINLTKTRGAGALAHEWFHALDNYFSRMRGGEVKAKTAADYRRQNFVTYKPEPLMVHKTAPTRPVTRARLEALRAANPNSGYLAADQWQPDPKHPQGVRPEVEERFAELVNALEASPFTKRSRAIDHVKDGGEGYWSQVVERAARAFESYVIHKMMQQGQHNDYLANVTPLEKFSRDPARYPYPTPAEIEPIAEAFDTLFGTLETKQDEAGNVAMMSRSEPTRQAYERRIDELYAGEAPKRIGARVLDGSDMLELLGHGRQPMHLVESKVESGRFNHHLTAEHWKRVPEWLENPVAVFDSETMPGRLVFVAPETVNGDPVLLIVHPGQRLADATVDMLVNAYDRSGNKIPVQRWLKADLLRYLDEARSPSFGGPSGLQLPRVNRPAKGSANTVLTDRDLVNLRAAGASMSRANAGRGVALSDADAAVALIRQALPKAPPIVVLDDVRKAPAELVRFFKRIGAMNDVEAVYHAGKVYVFPQHIESIDRLKFVVGRHEIRHYGLDAMLGTTKKLTLLGIGMKNPALMAAAKKKVAQGKAQTEIGGIEEVLADMPVEQIAALTGIDRLVARVRQWLREMAATLREKGWTTLADAIEPQSWTDNDIAAFVSKAEDVSRRGVRSVATGGTMMSRAGVTDTPEFKRWFGDSKVVDAQGKPLVVYHGTVASFDAFDPDAEPISYESDRGMQFFTSSAQAAGEYAGHDAWGPRHGANVMPVYLKIERPFETHVVGDPVSEWDGAGRLLRRLADDRDADGVIIHSDDTGEKMFVTFDPTQIKSATGNRGRFDATNPDIRMSVDAAASRDDTARYAADPDRNNLRVVDFAREQIAERRPGFLLRAVEAPGDRSDLRAARAFARRIAGHEAVFVRQDGERVFNGVAFGSPGSNYVLIDVDSPRPVMAVLGHEMLHRLRGARPDLYDVLERRLSGVLRNEGAYRDRINGRYDELGLKPLSDDAIHEELIADVFGDEWNDPAFWRAVAGDKPSGLRAVLDQLVRILDGLLAKAARIRPFGTDEYLADMQAARDAIAEATREFSRGEVGEMAEPAGELKFSAHTPEQKKALARAGIGGKRTLRERITGAYGRAIDAVSWSDFRQGNLDQFHGIDRAVRRDVGNLPIGQDPYITARLANGGTSSVMRALLLHGQAKWAANGQHLEKIDGTRGLLDILAPLGDNLNDWFGWMIGNRAARLMKEGRENNFTAADIQALQSLAGSRLAEFQKAAVQYAAFKRSVLDIAQQAGLIDPEARKAWDHADYIPFYRQIDEKATFSATGRKGLAGQSSGIRMLKGGESALNDPMENLLMNFSRLIDASLKNNALRKTIDALEAAKSDAIHKVGYDMKGAIVPAQQVRKVLEQAGTAPQVLDVIPPEVFDGMAKMWAIQSPSDPDVIRVMKDGKPQFYRVDDPLLLKAATSFVPFDFPGLGVARAFKRVLTAAVTATPEFMARNWIRDSMASQMIGRNGFSPHKSMAGIVKSYTESGIGEAMLFAGASFQSGNINAADPNGTAVAMRRALRQKGLDASAADAFMATVLDTPAKVWEQYRKVGEAVENANREAVAEATLKKTGDVTAAVYEAKDLMDFNLRGSSPGYQLLADVLPFFNARVQGLYRAGRANPRRLVAYGMVLMAASLALAMENWDRLEYEQLPDWDKDTYWHVWIGGKHFRIPKPFELGVVFATIPERIMRYVGDRDTGMKFAKRLWSNVRDQLAFDPMPQIARPAFDAAYNHASFQDRPIEGMADQGKLPHLRYSATTSDTAKVLLKATAPVTDKIELSPKKLEYLVGGYLGTVGLYALGLSDMAVREIMDAPARPKLRPDDMPFVKAFYRVEPARATVYESDLYQMREEVEKVYRSVNAHIKAGDADEARKLVVEHRQELGLREAVNDAAKTMADINKARDRIYADRTMAPEEKRLKIDRLQAQKNEVARKVMTHPKVREVQ